MHKRGNFFFSTGARKLKGALPFLGVHENLGY